MIFERLSIRKIKNLASICHCFNHLGDHPILIGDITPSLHGNPMWALDPEVFGDNITKNMSEPTSFLGLCLTRRSCRNGLWVLEIGGGRDKLPCKG